MNWRKELPVIFGFITFVIVLVSIFFHSQPYKYYESTSTIYNSLNIDGANEAKTIDDIKNWIYGLRELMAPISSYAIEVNCATSSDDSNCKHHSLIKDEFSTQTVTTGNGYYEVIQFSIFVQRGEMPVYQDDIFDDPKTSLSKTKSNSDGSTSEDPDVITVMHIDEKYVCVLIDGFKGELGSTLNWDGVYLHELYLFDLDSVAYIHMPHEKWVSYRPCFSFNNNSETTSDDYVIFGRGHPYFGSNISVDEYDWAGVKFEGMLLTSSHQVRRKCIELNSPETTAPQNFIAAVSKDYLRDNFDQHVESFSDLTEYWFSCSTITTGNITSSYLDPRFLTDPDVARVEFNGAYGNFFDTNNEYLWQIEAISTMMKLDTLGVFDSVRKSFKVYVTLRNVQNDRLFYALVSLTFSFSTSGRVYKDVEIAYVPIVQYYYGTEDYPVAFRTWYVVDILLVTLFVGVMIRIIFMIFKSTQEVVSIIKNRIRRNESDPPVKHVFELASSRRELNVNEGDLFLSSCENSQHDDVVDVEENIEDESSEIEGSILNEIEENQNANEGRLYSVLFSVEVMLNIALVLFLVIYASTRGIWYFVCKDLHSYIVDLPQDVENDYYRSAEHISTLVSKTENILKRELSSRYIAFFLALNAMVVFFFGLSKSRKFNVVTRSISRSIVKIWPTLFVLIVFLLAYAVLGSIIYGSFVSDWSSVYGSFSTLFIMMLGEYNAYHSSKFRYF